MKKPKLGKRKCKQCGVEFQKKNPLQSVCGVECAIDRSYDLNKAKRKKEVSDKVKGWSVDLNSTKNRHYLQKEINKLARLIDAKFGWLCIDCGRPYGKQIDGAHFHSVGSNSSLRYNLHNIHSARSDCNQYSATHKQGYESGIKERYGKEYFEMLQSLPLQHPSVRLSNLEVTEKLKLVRSLVRNFKTFNFSTALEGREIFNKLIAIYN